MKQWFVKSIEIFKPNDGAPGYGIRATLAREDGSDVWHVQKEFSGEDQVSVGRLLETFGLHIRNLHLVPPWSKAALDEK